MGLREELLMKVGAIMQKPFLESKAIYRTGQKFEDLNINYEVQKFFVELGRKQILFNPPYNHQAQALEIALTEKKDLVLQPEKVLGRQRLFFYLYLKEWLKKRSQVILLKKEQ